MKPMRQATREALVLFALFLGVAIWAGMTVQVTAGFLSGTPDWQVQPYGPKFNTYGEGPVELVAIPLVLVLTIAASVAHARAMLRHPAWPPVAGLEGTEPDRER